MVSGTHMLETIERMLDDTRRELESMDVELGRATSELDRLRQAELGVLSVLARVRLREIERGEIAETLEETGRRVKEILAQRADAQVEVGAEIAAAREVLAALERKRVAQHTLVAAAEQAIDAAKAEAQRGLAEDSAYRALLDRAQASDRVAELAEAKAQAAHADRVEKRKPYESDPLFTYLWARGYGTSSYRAGPLSRLLDGWVARVGDFQSLRPNYWMLSALPERFDEHARRMRELAQQDLAALQALEREAADAAGVPERERALAATFEAQRQIDEKIEAAEAELAALVEKRASFAAGEDELSRRCTELLSDALRRETMRALRAHARRTETPQDDAAVDELTVIRAETPRLEDEVSRYRKLHDAQRERLAKLEELRKRFKAHRFDAANSEFVNGALIATLLRQLLVGQLGVPDIWDALKRQQRSRSMSADPRFGSGALPRAPEPDAVGEPEPEDVQRRGLPHGRT
jgi:hypothetical protein